MIDDVANSTSYQSSSQINVQKQTTLGSHTVVVKNGDNVSAAVSFKVVAKGGVTPPSAELDAIYISDILGSDITGKNVHWSVQQGGQLSIYGKFLAKGNIVSIGSTTLSPTSQSATQIQVSIPSDIQTGNQIVVVKNGNLTSNGPTLSIISKSLTTLPSISISSIQGYSTDDGYTSSNAVISGQYLVLYGNFPASGSTVLIDDVANSTSYQSSSQINVQKQTTLGSHTVVVKNGDNVSAAVSFKVVAKDTNSNQTASELSAKSGSLGSTINYVDVYSWVPGTWSECVNGLQTLVASCIGNLSGTISATSNSGVGRCGFPYTGQTSRSCTN